MKITTLFPGSIRLLTLLTALALADSISAQEYLLSVSPAGPANIYRGYPLQNQTSFTITSTPAPDENLPVVFYLGGNDTAFTDDDPCDAQAPADFTITTAGVTTVPAPNTYQMIMPANHNSITITVKAKDTAGSGGCDNGYQLLLCSLPTNVDYTQGNYLVNTSARIVVANEYPPLPPITVSVQPNSFPPYLHKGTSGSISFNIVASSAPLQDMQVTFFAGGDGTAFPSDDTCYAVYGTDFNLTGASRAPFPNGFYFTLPAGQTSKTVSVSPLGSGCDCENGSQTLLMTIPSNPGAGYSPSTTSWQATGYIFPD